MKYLKALDMFVLGFIIFMVTVLTEMEVHFKSPFLIAGSILMVAAVVWNYIVKSHKPKNEE